MNNIKHLICRDIFNILNCLKTSAFLNAQYRFYFLNRGSLVETMPMISNALIEKINVLIKKNETT